MQNKIKPELEEAKIVQLIVFNLGEEEFAAEIGQIREIIELGPITPLPDSPDFIEGLINVRGEIIVVIEIKERFFLPRKEEVESKHIIVARQEKNLFGLVVDEVTEVLRIPETEIKAPPELVARIDRTYISGVLTIENRLIILLDLAKVLSEEDLARLSEIQRREFTVEERQTQRISNEVDTRLQKAKEEALSGPRAGAKDAKSVVAQLKSQKRTKSAKKGNRE